jgi:hypothetical protein
MWALLPSFARTGSLAIALRALSLPWVLANQPRLFTLFSEQFAGSPWYHRTLFRSHQQFRLVASTSTCCGS